MTTPHERTWGKQKPIQVGQCCRAEAKLRFCMFELFLVVSTLFNLSSHHY